MFTCIIIIPKQQRTTINSWALEYINYTRRTFIYKHKSTVPNVRPTEKETKKNYYPQFIFVNLALEEWI